MIKTELIILEGIFPSCLATINSLGVGAFDKISKDTGSNPNRNKVLES